ncbi:Translation initiation factor eIF-2B subunit gamma [Taxawa tesnikishii (nom. ined.)]|nr:Translation initiation factor eIF-2B subunit gamma [Dothideales sp. JES 119]
MGNPHLTSLPTPKPELVAPKDLTQTTATGDIFRLPEVQKVVTSDFIVLPCDIICELEGTSLLQSWMVLEAGLGGAAGGIVDGVPIKSGIGGERSGRRGGLGVWYPTKGLEGISTKGEETDFIATSPLPVSPVPAPEGSLLPSIEQLVLSIPTSTVKDITEEKKSFPIRHSLLKKHGRINMKTTHRDAHIYFFPFWVMEMIMKNESFESIAEDVLGWWAKAGWQRGLGDKLGLRDILEGGEKTPDELGDMVNSMELEDELDLAGLSSTCVTVKKSSTAPHNGSGTFASRVPAIVRPDVEERKPLTVPPILAYVQPPIGLDAAQPFVRRVDTSFSLLSVSLRLAKLPSIAEAAATGAVSSPFAHTLKHQHPEMMQKQSRVSEADSLVAENVTIESRVNIKESVIGVGCSIGSGSRLTRCLLMEGVVVGENVTLTGCILGRRCKVEGGGAKDEDKTKLTDCEVQPGFVVEWGSKCLQFSLKLDCDLTLTTGQFCVSRDDS